MASCSAGKGLAGRGCAVCGRAVPLLHLLSPLPASLPICQDPCCRQILQARERMSEALFRQHLDTQSRLIRARLAQRERRLEREAREAQEDRRAAASWSAEAGSPAAGGALFSLTLPTGPLQTAPLSRRRRQRYRRHLREVIAEAFACRGAAAAAADAPAEPADSSTLVAAAAAAGPLSRQLCGVCAGGCCPLGAEHAFINAAAVLRYLDAHPEAGPARVLQAYLDYLPAQSQKGGCVNQTAQGCSLPRAMRGETCNRYLCAALTGLQQAEQAEAAPQAVLIVQRRQNQWRRERPELDNRISALLLLTADGVRARKALP